MFVQAGQQTIADYVAGTAASSPTYRYVYASYIDEPVLRYQPSATESLYYHRNQQYSVTALTDGSGAIAERYAYSAYGVPTITNASGTLRSASTYDNRYLYTGREWDDVILMYHYRARMYDAELGRFCSKDPIGYSTQSGYANNFGNPVTNSQEQRRSRHRPWLQVHTVDKQASTEPPCSRTVGIDQRFTIPFAAADGGASYVIQKLTVTCGKKGCPCDVGEIDPPATVFTIFEAFRIQPGATMSDVDSWRLGPPPDQTCGSVTISGVAIYFPWRVLAELLPDDDVMPGWVDPLRGWSIQDKPFCLGDTFGFGPSPDPPGSLPFDTALIDTPFDMIPKVKRVLTRNWKCCCPPKDDQVSGTIRRYF
ncbi:MAG: RHS repeat-associated core domain-containing protein [Pirellulaceae bacterium]